MKVLNLFKNIFSSKKINESDKINESHCIEPYQEQVSFDSFFAEYDNTLVVSNDGYVVAEKYKIKRVLNKQIFFHSFLNYNGFLFGTLGSSIFLLNKYGLPISNNLFSIFDRYNFNIENVKIVKPIDSDYFDNIKDMEDSEISFRDFTGDVSEFWDVIISPLNLYYFRNPSTGLLVLDEEEDTDTDNLFHFVYMKDEMLFGSRGSQLFLLNDKGQKISKGCHYFKSIEKKENEIHLLSVTGATEKHEILTI